MSYDLVTVGRYDNSIQAHITKAHLEGHGLVCFVFDEHIVDMNPLYSNAIGGVKIKVREKDAPEARELIATLDKQPYTDDKDEIISCPKCGSTEYYQGYNSMRNAGSIMAFLVSLLIVVFPIYRKQVLRCKKCKTEFNSDGTAI